MKYRTLVNVCICAVLLSGCAKDISSSSYEESSVGSVGSVYPCTVVKVRKVKVNGNSKMSNNTLGMIGGAVAGGVLGNAIGGGRGRTLTTALGALAGAAGGAYAQQKMEEQVGLEYTIRMQNGELKTIVQGMDNQLAPGEAAYLRVSQGGSRVTAR